MGPFGGSGGVRFLCGARHEKGRLGWAAFLKGLVCQVREMALETIWRTWVGGQGGVGPWV